MYGHVRAANCRQKAKSIPSSGLERSIAVDRANSKEIEVRMMSGDKDGKSVLSCREH